MLNSSDIKNEEVKSSSSAGKYISYGVQELKINKIEVKESSKKSKQFVFHMEGKPSADLSFEGVDGAKGPVGKVFTFYFKEEEQKDLIKLLTVIADEIGVRAELDKITVATIEEYADKATVVLGGKFANFAIGSNQYINDKGYPSNKLKFLKYNFVEKIGTTPSKLQFDPTNKYHFEAAVKPDNIGTPESATFIKPDGNDLPF